MVLSFLRFLLFVNNRAYEVTDNLSDIPPVYLFPFEKYKVCIFINEYTRFYFF